MNRDRIIENCDAVLHGFSVDGGGLEEIAATCKQLLAQGVDGAKIAKARDAWLETTEGLQCLQGNADGAYLRNRLLIAFEAGAKFISRSIKDNR